MKNVLKLVLGLCLVGGLSYGFETERYDGDIYWKNVQKLKKSKDDRTPYWVNMRLSVPQLQYIYNTDLRYANKDQLDKLNRIALFNFSRAMSGYRYDIRVLSGGMAYATKHNDQKLFNAISDLTFREYCITHDNTVNAENRYPKCKGVNDDLNTLLWEIDSKYKYKFHPVESGYAQSCKGRANGYDYCSIPEVKDAHNKDLEYRSEVLSTDPFPEATKARNEEKIKNMCSYIKQYVYEKQDGFGENDPITKEAKQLLTQCNSVANPTIDDVSAFDRALIDMRKCHYDVVSLKANKSCLPNVKTSVSNTKTSPDKSNINVSNSKEDFEAIIDQYASKYDQCVQNAISKLDSYDERRDSNRVQLFQDLAEAMQNMANTDQKIEDKYSNGTLDANEYKRYVDGNCQKLNQLSGRI